MGFGIKTDFATGRQLDLNKTYKVLIKPVVENKGILCVRADEIKHSGSIDLQMYRELLEADIVIADLSTANPNALYELGIRHALRPRTTIVISEEQLPYPFDLNHISIQKYTHLGHAIDYEEVERFRQLLSETIDNVLNSKDPDSPVYTYLRNLMPPVIKEESSDIPPAGTPAFYSDSGKEAVAEDISVLSPGNFNISLSTITEAGEEALENNKFHEARQYFEEAYAIFKSIKKNDEGNDPYIVQRLALCIYKSSPLDNKELQYALDLLYSIGLKHSNDTETVVLAGRISRRLFYNGEGVKHLEKAIEFFQRGYFLLHNRYNGINLALLLTRRVDTDLYPKQSDKITDLVWANRIRREVIEISNNEFKMLMQKAAQPVLNQLPNDENITKAQDKSLAYNKFWILANTAHAYYGLGQMDTAKDYYAEALKLPHEQWMINSVNDDFKVMYQVLSKYGIYCDPQWKGEDMLKASLVGQA